MITHLQAARQSYENGALGFSCKADESDMGAIAVPISLQLWLLLRKLKTSGP